MHQCDLTLNANSEAELQYIVSSYALVWRYKFNAQMSSVIDIGESPLSRRLARPKRCWYIQGTPIPEKDEQKHLGILHSVSFSTVARTVERAQLVDLPSLH